MPSITLCISSYLNGFEPLLLVEFPNGGRNLNSSVRRADLHELPSHKPKILVLQFGIDVVIAPCFPNTEKYAVRLVK